MYNNRVEAIQHKLSELKADAVLIMNPDNVYYFSGFTGTAGYILITSQSITLLTDFRYLDQAAEQSAHCKIVDTGNDFYQAVSESLADVTNVLYEEDFLTVKQFNKLKSLIKYNWLPLEGLIEKLRVIKDEYELDFLRKAAKIADDAFLHILKYIKPGVKELEIAAELEHFMRKAGSEGPSFNFIVASGARGAMPHGVASPKEVSSGELLTLDFGAIYKGYHSDITRTVAIGEPSEKMRNIYEIVYKANAESLAMVSQGMKCKDIDAKARDIITKEGYGENFRHGLGHALGLDVHEEPRFNTKDETFLAANMVMTVEPGIYIAGVGGVRIEDSVIVKSNGYELLTNVTKELIIL